MRRCRICLGWFRPAHGFRVCCSTRCSLANLRRYQREYKRCYRKTRRGRRLCREANERYEAKHRRASR